MKEYRLTVPLMGYGKNSTKYQNIFDKTIEFLHISNRTESIWII